MSAQVEPLPRAGVVQWYRDTVSCLQTTVATVLAHAGEDPLAALGLAWEFRHLPGDVRPEEYYWPCPDGDVARALLPHHPVSSRWRTATGPDPLAEVGDALAAGLLPILAVDNFHLPFRPAWQDVHAAHLLVVHALDATRDVAGVSDAMPPAFLGPLDVDHLARAWFSAMPDDPQDVFFSGATAGTGRWLEVRLHRPFPELDQDRLGRALRGNHETFTGSAAGDDGADVGLAGFARFRDRLLDGIRAGDGGGLREVYTFGWGMQAQAAMHGELLRRLGAEWRMPPLAEAGRRVELVAHTWSAVRVAGAHGHADPRAVGVPVLRRALNRLGRAYEEAVELVADAATALTTARASNATATSATNATGASSRGVDA